MTTTKYGFEHKGHKILAVKKLSTLLNCHAFTLSKVVVGNLNGGVVETLHEPCGRYGQMESTRLTSDTTPPYMLSSYTVPPNATEAAFQLHACGWRGKGLPMRRTEDRPQTRSAIDAPPLVYLIPVGRISPRRAGRHDDVRVVCKTVKRFRLPHQHMRTIFQCGRNRLPVAH